MFIVRRGVIRVFKTRSGQTFELDQRGPGELVGETALIEGERRFTSAVCETDSRLFVLPVKDFYDVIASHPGVSQHVLQFLTRRARAADARRLSELENENRMLEAHTIMQDQLATKGEMAAEIAHELRNYLLALSAHAGLLAHCIGETDNKIIRRSLAGIDQSIERVKVFTENLLQSRHPAGQKITIDLNAFLDDQIAFLQPQKRFRRLDIQTQWDLSIPPLSCEPSSLQQVVYNLLLNAAEACAETSGRPPTVILRTDFNRDGNMIRLHIADNGPGIDPDLLERLFAERVTSKPAGHGFGLFAVARIIGEHGGTITARNRPQGGAEFSIALPVV
jgi:signal transduction histidine kinase